MMTKSKQDIWDIAHKHAKLALAAIANHQMTTWAKFPPTNTAQDFVREAILNALKEASGEEDKPLNV